MKLFKNWSEWRDIQIRKDYRGYNYLLQMRIDRDSGFKQFNNIPLDDHGILSIITHSTVDESRVISH